MKFGRMINMYIYPIDLYDFHRKYLVLKNEDIEVAHIIEEFQKISGLGSDKYAGNLFASILFNFFGEIEDVHEVYENYYSKEYQDLTEYLYKKMIVNYSEIDFIQKKMLCGEKIYFVDLENVSVNNYENLFEDENEDLLKKINNVLEKIV